MKTIIMAALLIVSTTLSAQAQTQVARAASRSVERIMLVSYTHQLTVTEEQAIQKFVLTKFPGVQFVKDTYYSSSVEFSHRRINKQVLNLQLKAAFPNLIIEVLSRPEGA